MWLLARDELLLTRDWLPAGDAPSARILDFMKEHDYQAPEGWEGHHEVPI